MAAVAGSGTQTAVVATEHTLLDVNPPAAPAAYVLAVDLGAMLNIDEVTLRCYVVVLSAGTEREVYRSTYLHAQALPIVYSIPVVADVRIRFTLQQQAGTARTFPWKVYSL